MPAKGEFTVSAVKTNKTKYLTLKMGWHEIKINCCPFCGETAKEIIENY